MFGAGCLRGSGLQGVTATDWVIVTVGFGMQESTALCLLDACVVLNKGMHQRGVYS
jgi:hypothetical protein